MARALLLTLVFPPAHVSPAHLMGDLICDRAAAGHTVTVITTTPHYHRAVHLTALADAMRCRIIAKGIDPAKSDAVPSKVYRIMGAEFPVLAITVPGPDLETLVKRGGVRGHRVRGSTKGVRARDS